MTVQTKESGGAQTAKAKGAGKGKTVPPATSFEDALAKLEDCARRLASDDISLEDAIRCYEEGVGYYRSCGAILEEAKQKIEVIGQSAPGEAPADAVPDREEEEWY